MNQKADVAKAEFLAVGQAEHIPQDCRDHQRLKEDRWTQATTVQSKVYRTRDDRLWDDR